MLYRLPSHDIPPPSQKIASNEPGRNPTRILPDEAIPAKPQPTQRLEAILTHLPLIGSKTENSCAPGSACTNDSNPACEKLTRIAQQDFWCGIVPAFAKFTQKNQKWLPFFTLVTNSSDFNSYSWELITLCMYYFHRSQLAISDKSPIRTRRSG